MINCTVCRVLGHSVTVIGTERVRRDGESVDNLLLFDPLDPVEKVIDAIRSGVPEDLAFLRYTPSMMAQNAYQILFILGVLPNHQYDLAKSYVDGFNLEYLNPREE